TSMDYEDQLRQDWSRRDPMALRHRRRWVSLGSDGSGFGIKREGTADETGTPGQV
ncbi:hypothetical protein BGZ82_007553, partial [Podila clonocystis]